MSESTLGFQVEERVIIISRLVQLQFAFVLNGILNGRSIAKCWGKNNSIILCEIFDLIEH